MKPIIEYEEMLESSSGNTSSSAGNPTGIATGPFLKMRNRIRSVALVLLMPLVFLGSCSDPFPDMDGLDAVLLSSALKKYIFASQATYPGAFKNTTDANGIESADAVCAWEKGVNFPGLPGASNEYKAFLVSDHRRACTSANCTSGGTSEHLDWVLFPQTSYYNTSDQLIFTTDSNGVSNLSANPLARVFTSSVSFYWTGFEDSGDWTTSTLGQTCNEWASGGSNGMRGDATSRGTAALGAFAQDSSCGTAQALLCVRR
ncbi:MAG: hypothetical protein CMN77_18795 [Spirochaetaceae bacterium]|nr:hypothetical protein [Spirochaetaceae bacterium]|tara:strand:+ start:15984 stop:16760 length:777 start_codon:yes stop_codon:yes gene_type:complete